LAPLEERWEAVEECERLFEGTLRRYSTGSIGLADVTPSLRLIRIGTPTGAEFAAWRYGRRLQIRRYRAAAQMVVGTLAAAPIFVLGSGMAFGLSGLALAGYAGLLAREQYAAVQEARGRTVRRQRIDQGGRTMRYLRIRPTDDELGWALEDPARGLVFTGRDVPQKLSTYMPRMNWWCGSTEHQDQALRLIDESHGPRPFLMGLRTRRLETFSSMTRSERLAVEMAANEEVEARVLQGDLQELLEAWRHADETASIADSLLIPLPISEKLVMLKAHLRP
jgi:hypothetical protein